MAFSITLSLGTVGSSISNVKLYGCTGTTGGICTNCTPIVGYESVSVVTFPRIVSGIPDGSTYIRAEVLGDCGASTQQCIAISNVPVSPTPPPSPNNTPSITPSFTPSFTPSITTTPSITISPSS